MELRGRFETVGFRGFYRVEGPASAGQLADRITGALEQARAVGVRDMVVDIRAVSGLDSPGPAYRRWAARRWARALGPRVRIAMVARSEHICPEKTGLLVAAEEGVDAHICETEPDAIAWLDRLSEAAPPDRAGTERNSEV